MASKLISSLVAAAAMFSVSALAAEYKAGDIVIDNVWAPQTAQTAKSAGVYLVIKNNGTKADVLTQVSSPVADKVEVHANTTDKNVAKMAKVQSVQVPAGQTVALSSDNQQHIMLIGLKQALQNGQSVPLTLTFENAGQVQVEATVEQQAPAAVPAKTSALSASFAVASADAAKTVVAPVDTAADADKKDAVKPVVPAEKTSSLKASFAVASAHAAGSEGGSTMGGSEGGSTMGGSEGGSTMGGSEGGSVVPAQKTSSLKAAFVVASAAKVAGSAAPAGSEGGSAAGSEDGSTMGGSAAGSPVQD